MGDIVITPEQVRRMLKGNLGRFLADTQHSSRHSQFEQAVVRALAAKGVNGSFCLVEVPVYFHPYAADLSFNNGTPMSPPYVPSSFQVAVEEWKPNIKGMDPRPDRGLTAAVVEQTIQMYNKLARQIPLKTQPEAVKPVSPDYNKDIYWVD